MLQNHFSFISNFLKPDLFPLKIKKIGPKPLLRAKYGSGAKSGTMVSAFKVFCATLKRMRDENKDSLGWIPAQGTDNNRTNPKGSYICYAYLYDEI